MPFNPTPTPPRIRRTIVAADLAVLSEEEASNADVDGCLAGNQHYNDLRGMTFADLEATLVREDGLVDAFEAVGNPAALEERFVQERGTAFEPVDDLWGLDVGVAGAVIALSALGATPVSSCNGAVYGTPHQSHYPYVAFFLADADLSVLLGLAEAEGLGLVGNDGLAHLYGSVPALRRFARRALDESSTG